MSETMLREPCIRWDETYPGLPKASPEIGLQRMCDYGAKAVANGKCDGLELRIWVTERDFVERYMAQHHPTVPYRMNWPTWKWRQEHKH